MIERIRVATGRVPEGAARLSATDLRPPDSAFARAAEEAAREQSKHMEGHGYRTWIYGSALAAIDRVDVDPELFYVACLLHDHGLITNVGGQDFTLRGAARAENAATAWMRLATGSRWSPTRSRFTSPQA
ncbi:hypothetical protein [Nocardia gipuzkoensis]|uniref:hypothetical protein n=1 Tax=Nocardia gipuzkoensis TaxID=2749991 RepID=UPI003EE3EEF0